MSGDERNPCVLVVAALAERGDADGRLRVFLARRAGGRHAGLWELPGGKVEPGEEPGAALLRELEEELGIVAVIEGPPSSYGATVDGVSFDFLVFRCGFDSNPRILTAHDDWRYFDATELPGLELAPLDAPALRDWARPRRRQEPRSPPSGG